MLSETSGKKTEFADAAWSLFESGKGAYQRNDRDAAMIFLAIALKLFEKADDEENAKVVSQWRRAAS